jgi:hypothetical protein
MLPEHLETKENEIRAAVARRQYGDLPRMLEDLRVMVDEHIHPFPKDDPTRLAIFRRMLATNQWARLMLATQRQIWSTELSLIAGLGRYLDREDRRQRGVCLDI